MALLLLQAEGAVVADGCDAKVAREPASSVNHRHLPQQVVPIHVHSLPPKADLAQMEPLSRPQAAMEGQNQVRLNKNKQLPRNT